MLDECSPCLPLELERIIFEMSSYSRGDSTKHLLNLMLVARYVHDWIKPILYRTYLQSPRTKIPDIRRFPGVNLDKVGKYSRNLLLSEEIPQKQVMSLLSIFPHIENLAIWTNRTDLAHFQDSPEFHTLSLRRLSVFVSDLTGIKFSGASFQSLTHFELIRTRREPWDAWLPLTELPRLSHLLVNSAVPADVTDALLACCPRLACLIQLVSIYIVDKWGVDQRTQLCGSDPRLVSFSYTCSFNFIHDWHAGVRGGMDNWARGEAVCTARRMKYFVYPTPRWIPNDSDWTDDLNEAGQEWYSTL